MFRSAPGLARASPGGSELQHPSPSGRRRGPEGPKGESSMQGHDEACFRLLASGDEEMLEILIDTYALRVKQYAFDQLHDDYDAEDIAIATFTAVFLRNRNRGWRHASYETMCHLLVVTAKGLIGDLRRRRKLEEERRQILLRFPGPIAETPATRALKNEMLTKV